MKSGANKIPILTFHALENTTSPMAFPPALFERALKTWHAAGWRTIALSDAAQNLRERAPFPEKTFVITFDDGYVSVYQAAFPVLRECGMTATVFVAPNAEGQTADTTRLPPLYGRAMLRWGEIRELRAYGIHFGAHTLTHANLIKLDDRRLRRELCESRDILADALGEKISLFAYPFGKYNGHVREMTAQYYDAACSDRLGIANFSSDLLALERVETFYLRPLWAADGLTRSWFPWYLHARNVPRSVRRWVKWHVIEK